MSESILAQLVSAHERLAIMNELDLEPTSDETLADFAHLGYVRFPLAAAQVEELEAIAGFSFTPLLRSLLTTRAAMPHFGVDVFGIGEWAAERIVEKNRDIASARAQFNWDLPKLLVITNDEDFHAVTEDGIVIGVCSNEGNIEVDYGPLESWLLRYGKAAQRKAEGADGDDVWEDPEARHV